MNATQADSIDYGLYIKSFPFNDQEKTSLILENNQPIKLHSETTMSFDMSVRKDNVFGVVFRMITDKKENIDLIFTVGEEDKRYPMLVVNESVYMISKEISCNEWLPVSITLSSEKNEIAILYGETELSVPYQISRANEVRVSFGLCPFEGYTLYDIASVNIRDVKIFNGKNLRRHWKLERHDEKQSPDSVAQVPAVATNPRWIIDIYATWEKIYSKHIKENSLFAFNPNEDIIYIASPDSKELIAFDASQKEENIITVKSGIIAANAPNQLFYNPVSNKLLSYNLDENIISVFNPVSESWENNTKSLLEHAYWNNSVSFFLSDSSLVSFGGYGFYKYNNELLRLNPGRKSIKKSNLPDISPRHSSSTVIVNNTLYIYGGWGNKTGRQELSPRNYYDFYSVNLLTEQTNKLWEMETPASELEFLPGENMIYDEKEDCFYVFTSQNGGTLMRLKKDRAGFELMSFPIHEDLTAHYLYMKLYYSKKDNTFYVLINKIKTDKFADVTIYSLNYPPIALSEIQVTPPTAEAVPSSSIGKIVIIVLGLVCVFAFPVYFLIKRRLFRKKTGKRVMASRSVIVPAVTEVKVKEPEVRYYDFSGQSVCFLGGFLVMDKDGRNITGQFSPMLKYLLVLLILSTEKDSKGISGKKLIQLLWFDKNEESAKNNRNVYLSKLRTILENVGNAEIINQNGFWSIKLNEGIVCDYTESMRLFGLIKGNTSPDHANIDRLLELLLRGVLLPNTEADWVDGFKSDFSNTTIDILTELSQSDYYKPTDDLKLKIADTLFLHDYINEEALYLKCSILFNSGKKGIAKGIYDNFCKEYYNLLDSKYKYSLTDVISRKNIED
jgi:DNA-binding SARP family transcriptional activator/DNA-binding beta-propeller fold protein YncE